MDQEFPSQYKKIPDSYRFGRRRFQYFVKVRSNVETAEVFESKTKSVGSQTQSTSFQRLRKQVSETFDRWEREEAESSKQQSAKSEPSDCKFVPIEPNDSRSHPNKYATLRRSKVKFVTGSTESSRPETSDESNDSDQSDSLTCKQPSEEPTEKVLSDAAERLKSRQFSDLSETLKQVLSSDPSEDSEEKPSDPSEESEEKPSDPSEDPEEKPSDCPENEQGGESSEDLSEQETEPSVCRVYVAAAVGEVKDYNDTLKRLKAEGKQLTEEYETTLQQLFTLLRGESNDNDTDCCVETVETEEKSNSSDSKELYKVQSEFESVDWEDEKEVPEYLYPLYYPGAGLRKIPQSVSQIIEQESKEGLDRALHILESSAELRRRIQYPCLITELYEQTTNINEDTAVQSYPSNYPHPEVNEVAIGYTEKHSTLQSVEPADYDPDSHWWSIELDPGWNLIGSSVRVIREDKYATWWIETYVRQHVDSGKLRFYDKLECTKRCKWEEEEGFFTKEENEALGRFLAWAASWREKNSNDNTSPSSPSSYDTTILTFEDIGTSEPCE